MKAIEESDLSRNLANVYKDVHGIKIETSDSFDSLLKKFYDVMTKWNICQGHWSENGRSVCSAEWCMCFAVFKTNIDNQFNWAALMSTPPNHLLAYGKKPKKQSDND